MNVIIYSLFLSFSCIFCAPQSTVYPHHLRVQHLKNPLAVDSPNPRLSWRLEGISFNGTTLNNLKQTSYQILAATDSKFIPENPDLWDTGKVKSDSQVNVKYEGQIPSPGSRIFWTVRVWDQNDTASSYANISFWNNAFNESQWSALWISATMETQVKALTNISSEDNVAITSHPGLKPVVYLRKTFFLEEVVKEAKIYATSKGLYTVFLFLN